LRGASPLETALLPTVLPNELAQHAVDFWPTTEDLPDPQNSVTVDRSGNLTLSYTPNNQVPRLRRLVGTRAEAGINWGSHTWG
jgi:hypothetical protein